MPEHGLTEKRANQNNYIQLGLGVLVTHGSMLPPPKKFVKGSMILLLKDATKVAVTRRGIRNLIDFKKKKKDKSRGRDLAHTRQGILG